MLEVKAIFLVLGKQKELVQGFKERIGQTWGDGSSTSEDEDAPSAQGCVYLGDCGERFSRGEGAGDKKGGTVDDRNLLHYFLVVDCIFRGRRKN